MFTHMWRKLCATCVLVPDTHLMREVHGWGYTCAGLSLLTHKQGQSVLLPQRGQSAAFQPLACLLAAPLPPGKKA